ELQQSLLELKSKIENIVCLALGGLHGLEIEPKRRKYCMQHHMVCATAKFLSQHYASFSPSVAAKFILIVAFDPCYTLEDAHILSKLSTPITVVSQPYQYLSVTPNTLVLCFHAPGFEPIYEIIADLLFPAGPAAMLCNMIVEHSWHKEGKMSVIDQRVPRVGKMLEQYDSVWLDAGWDCGKQNVKESLRWTQDVVFIYEKARTLNIAKSK
ncbi:hypothetical protein P153DRAFT_281454, partial [Dothidotthia symphoricarpi CBS 119687]